MLFEDMKESNDFRVYKINKGRFPKEFLNQVSDLPDEVRKSRLVLSPFVNDPGIDTNLVVDHPFRFYEKTTGEVPYYYHISPEKIPPGHYFLKSGRPLKYPIPANILEGCRKSKMCEEAYGVPLENLLVIHDCPEKWPTAEKQVEFRIVAHEALHTYFDHLPEETRTKILEAAKQDLGLMSEVEKRVPKDIYPYEFERKVQDEISRIEQNDGDANHLKTFSNLVEYDQWDCLHEYISHSFSSYYQAEFEPGSFTPILGQALKDAGYKVRAIIEKQ